MTRNPTLALRTVLGRVRALKVAYRRAYAWRRRRDLRRFHQAVSSSELAGRWWIWGGTLLGLRRSGDILDWDRDLDVAVRRADLPALMRTIDSLVALGFKAQENFLDRGQLVAAHLVRHGFDYDFSVLDEADDGKLRYRAFTVRDDEVVLIEGAVPSQSLGSIRAWGCDWPCASDADVDLSALYGSSWRIPNPAWSALDSPSILSVTPCNRPSSGWTPLTRTGQIVPAQGGTPR